MFLTNEELEEFFKLDLRGEGSDEKLLRIPKNQDCMFMFTYLKEQTRDLLVFLDSGCNFWVSRSGVPEQELRAVKLSDGNDNIRFKEAGGTVIKAESEWGALLPLNDGTSQLIWFPF